MADLVPRHQLAEITTLLGAPYVNSFGATETGLPPATAALIPIGAAPTDLAKRQSAFCEVRLVDADDRDVPDGAPGECAIRGPTLFSGYWRAPEVNAKDFRGGWFHMGDVFVRRDDGRLDFVDRAKYLIKSGGENVYPAEIERVLLADPRVGDAVVVRRPDAKWGEVPVAVVARNDERLTADELLRQVPRASSPATSSPRTSASSRSPTCRAAPPARSSATRSRRGCSARTNSRLGEPQARPDAWSAPRHRRVALRCIRPGAASMLLRRQAAAEPGVAWFRDRFASGTRSRHAREDSSPTDARDGAFPSGARAQGRSPAKSAGSNASRGATVTDGFPGARFWRRRA